MTYTIKHGPWEAYKVGSGHWRVIQGAFPERLPVVTLDASRDGYEPFREETVPARAHLIASAPDLYAALAALLAALPQDILIDNEDEANAAWENAQAALAKARGE